LYQRLGGKTARHGHIPEVDKVVSISNVGVQLFQPKAPGSNQWNPRIRRDGELEPQQTLFALIQSCDVLWSFEGSASWPIFDGQVIMPSKHCDVAMNILDNISAVLEIRALLRKKPEKDED
jgi:hypothetical protein